MIDFLEDGNQSGREGRACCSDPSSHLAFQIILFGLFQSAFRRLLANSTPGLQQDFDHDGFPTSQGPFSYINIIMIYSKPLLFQVFVFIIASSGGKKTPLHTRCTTYLALCLKPDAKMLALSQLMLCSTSVHLKGDKCTEVENKQRTSSDIYWDNLGPVF